MKTRTQQEIAQLATLLGYADKVTVRDQNNEPVIETVPQFNNDGTPIIIDGKQATVEVTKTEDNPQPRTEYIEGYLDAHLDSILKEQARREEIAAVNNKYT